MHKLRQYPHPLAPPDKGHTRAECRTLYRLQVQRDSAASPRDCCQLQHLLCGSAAYSRTLCRRRRPPRVLDFRLCDDMLLQLTSCSPTHAYPLKWPTNYGPCQIHGPNPSIPTTDPSCDTALPTYNEKECRLSTWKAMLQVRFVCVGLL